MSQSLQIAMEQLLKLPPDLQETMASLILNELDLISEYPPVPSEPKVRQFGLFPGIVLSDDFDEELPDTFWGWDSL